MKIIIFGGTGFIGRNLANNLSAKHEVTVYDNNNRRYSDLGLSASVNQISGDILDKAGVEEAIRGKDVVFNLAYINGTSSFYKIPDKILRIAIEGQLNICNAIEKFGVETFCYASSSEVYQHPGIFPTPENIPLTIPDINNPRFSYGGGKIVGELLTTHLLHNVDRKIVFRPHNVFGPNMGFEHVIPNLIHKVQDTKDGTVVIQGSGKETRSFCFIDDAVAQITLLLEKRLEGIFNIGVEDETSIEDLTHMISDVMQKPVSIKRGELLEGSVLRRVPDTSSITSLGFVPTVSLLAGLRKTIDWYTNEFTK